MKFDLTVANWLAYVIDPAVGVFWNAHDILFFQAPRV